MKRQNQTAASIPRIQAAAASAQRPRFLRKSTASSLVPIGIVHVLLLLPSSYRKSHLCDCFSKKNADCIFLRQIQVLDNPLHFVNGEFNPI